MSDDDPCPVCGKGPTTMFFEIIGLATIVAGIVGLGYWVWSHLTWTW